MVHCDAKVHELNLNVCSLTNIYGKINELQKRSDAAVGTLDMQKDVLEVEKAALRTKFDEYA